jgi:hypothetical protein
VEADAAEAVCSAEGVGAWPAGKKFPNWNWKSRPTFGHTFETHGAGARNTARLRGRAASETTAEQQGQWLDNKAAADFLSSERNYITAPTVVEIPPGLGQVVPAVGDPIVATHAMLVPSEVGYITAYPIVQ